MTIAMCGMTFINWDWKSSPDFEDLQNALDPLGVRVYWDPAFEGSDTFGFVFSLTDLTAGELQSISNIHHS